MVCQDHVTVYLEHRLPGLGERQLLNEATVPIEFVHRTKSPGPKRRVSVARVNGLVKGTNIVYANTIKGVLEYHLMYFLYNNKNQ